VSVRGGFAGDASLRPSSRSIRSPSAVGVTSTAATSRSRATASRSSRSPWPAASSWTRQGPSCASLCQLGPPVSASAAGATVTARRIAIRIIRSYAMPPALAYAHRVELPVDPGPMLAVPPGLRYRVTDMLGTVPADGAPLEGAALDRLTKLIDDGEAWLGPDP